MIRSVRTVMVLALLLGAAISGCGQKGPLYLPGEGAATEQGEER